MNGWSLSRRAERLVLVLLAIVSASATAVVISDASGNSEVRLAVLAAARGRALQSRAALVAALGARNRIAAEAASQASPAPAPVSDGATADVSSGADPAAPSVGGTPAVSPSATPASAPVASPAPSTPSTPSSPGASTPAATVSHLFEIVLEGTGYAASFGPASRMPYLRSLVARGTLLSGYRSLGHGPLADELALVSGQSPNADTSSGCPTYTEFPTGTTVNAAGLVSGAGCVYPETVLTLGDQVSSAGHQWRAYVDGMGTRSCQHPNSDSADATVLPGSEPSYDTRANPFIYFHSLLDLGDCANDDLDLSHFHAGPGHSAPSYVYVAPSLCAEPTASPAPAPTSTSSSTTSTSTVGGPATGSATTGAGTTSSATTQSTTTSSPVTAGPAATPACPAGRPSGVAAQDAFLRSWVPRVLGSAAYRDKGALVIAFTAPADGGHPVRAGALLLRSSVTRRAALSAAVSPYALLRGVETALGLGLLGEAKHAPASVVFPSAHPSERTRRAGKTS